MAKNFDLIEYQRDARERKSPADLYDLWNEVLYMKEKGLIGDYEVDEMRAIIFPRLETLSAMAREINATFQSS
jgi:hypothetical protein